MESIAKLWTGRAGLAKTYWGYGILGAVIWALVLSALPQGAPITIAAVLVFCAYLMAVNVGVWRAASNYTGAPTWAALGKVAAGVGMFIAVATLALVLGAVTGGRPVPQAPAMTIPTQPPSSPASEAEWWKKGATQVN